MFANSVLGARTNRYGDFIDICAAITGRVPAAGLHLDEHRRGSVVFRLADDVPERLLHDEITPTCVGHIVGLRRRHGRARHRRAPRRDGRGSAEGARRRRGVLGAVAMFHAVGITPEAPTLEDALGGNAVEREFVITRDRLRAARDELTTVGAARSPP